MLIFYVCVRVFMWKNAVMLVEWVMFYSNAYKRDIIDRGSILNVVKYVKYLYGIKLENEKTLQLTRKKTIMNFLK